MNFHLIEDILMGQHYSFGYSRCTGSVDKGCQIFFRKAWRPVTYGIISFFKSAPGIKEIGKNWGESFDQGLLTSVEADIAYEMEDMYVIPPEYKKAVTSSPYKGGALSSSNVPLISKEEIGELLDNSGALPPERK